MCVCMCLCMLNYKNCRFKLSDWRMFYFEKESEQKNKKLSKKK